MHRGKTLLNHVDSDYKKKIEEEAHFKLPPFRSGDAVEVILFNSLSEGTYNVFNGIIFENAMANNLRRSFSLPLATKHTVSHNNVIAVEGHKDRNGDRDRDSSNYHSSNY